LIAAADAAAARTVLDTPQTEWLTGVYTPIIVGEIKMYAGSTPPDGWLTCDGSEKSRTEYADLFEVIGETYGVGDGSTTFNLPNLNGRTAIGSGQTTPDVWTEYTIYAAGQYVKATASYNYVYEVTTAGTSGGTEPTWPTTPGNTVSDGTVTWTCRAKWTSRNVGEVGGEESHYQKEAEIATHTHTGTTDSDGSHSHTWTSYDTGAGNPGIEYLAASLDWNVPSQHSITTSTAPAHTHTFTTGSKGSGSATNQMQPYAVVNFIIKY
jgi:microcystin-dependent protein